MNNLSTATFVFILLGFIPLVVMLSSVRALVRESKLSPLLQEVLGYLIIMPGLFGGMLATLAITTRVNVSEEIGTYLALGYALILLGIASMADRYTPVSDLMSVLAFAFAGAITIAGVIIGLCKLFSNVPPNHRYEVGQALCLLLAAFVWRHIFRTVVKSSRQQI